jgi:hypothetical protein
MSRMASIIIVIIIIIIIPIYCYYNRGVDEPPGYLLLVSNIPAMCVDF